MLSKSSSGLTIPLKIHFKVSTFCTIQVDTSSYSNTIPLELPNERSKLDVRRSIECLAWSCSGELVAVGLATGQLELLSVEGQSEREGEDHHHHHHHQVIDLDGAKS